MPRQSQLPDRLRYLQPFRKKFRSIEGLNEDTGFEPLVALFGKRIADLESVGVEKNLEEDISTLQEWLAKPEQQNDPLHFAAGVLLIMSPAEIIAQAKALKEESPKKVRQVLMDLPAGAKRRKLRGLPPECLFFVWNGIDVFVSAEVPPLDQDGNCKPDLAYHIRPADTFTTIRFEKEQLTGTKYIAIGENLFGRPLKRVAYFLDVPGGPVQVSADFSPKMPRDKDEKEARRLFMQIDCAQWDETPIEAQFHTIKIVEH